MRKILVAIDDTPCSLNAVEHVSRQLSGVDDVDITLFHVLPYVPAGFWDDGHILTEEERQERKKVVDRWLSNQALKLDPLFQTAIKVLSRGGIPAERITIRSVSDSTDVAGSILEEAGTGGYQTLVMGRCGRSQAERHLIGSVASKVISQGAGIAICIVE